jgi:hypothetical protein
MDTGLRRYDTEGRVDETNFGIGTLVLRPVQRFLRRQRANAAIKNAVTPARGHGKTRRAMLQ